jgi:hypothetical protein
MSIDASLRAAGAAIGAVLGSLAPPPEAPAPAPAALPEAVSAETIRSRERMALLALSTLVQAEKAYAARNGLFFDDVRCLVAPAGCIPGFPAEDAPFLDPTYPWLEPRLGYARKLHAGPKAAPEQISRAGASPSSLVAVAFTVTPLVPGKTGGRAFCGDTSGRMCVTPDGREPPVKDGKCEPCKKLE